MCGEIACLKDQEQKERPGEPLDIRSICILEGPHRWHCFLVGVCDTEFAYLRKRWGSKWQLVGRRVELKNTTDELEKVTDVEMFLVLRFH